MARSVCPYCGVGCGQQIFHNNGKLISIEGDPASPISRGRLCPKGSASYELLTHSKRLTKVKYRRPFSKHWEDLELGKAMEMILSGEIVDAQTAFLIGLVNHVVPADQLETKTMEIANRIAEKSPIALRLAKEAVKVASRSNLDEGLRREADLFAICFSSEDKDEGVKAFLEKRKPEFKGR